MIDIILWIIAGNIGTLFIAFEMYRSNALNSVTVGHTFLYILLCVGGWFTFVLGAIALIVFEATEFFLNGPGKGWFELELFKVKKDED